MSWQKLGLVYQADDRGDWARHSALQPTPLQLENGVIRVYVGMRDYDGRSSVGFIEIDAKDPRRVLNVSEDPALFRGPLGAFDEDGVVPCAVVRREGEVYLYYAGYQRAEGPIRFRAFTGLAISSDGGRTFERSRPSPILPPVPGEDLFRAIHCLRFEGGRWRAWYGAGDTFREGMTKTLPVYGIRYMESEDGITFPDSGRDCLQPTGDEYRLGRPCVVGEPGGYEMFYGWGTEALGYRLGYAVSHDGLDWVRRDAELGLEPTPGGFDERMMAYPAVVDTRGSRLLLYNGNDYGREGFGCAIAAR